MLILIVDDDDDCRRIYRIALEHAGHAVLLANDGIDALRIGRAAEPDLILMDIAMPNMDGYDALRRLRVHRPTRDLRIVALTAAASQYDESDFLERGFNGLLTKPLTPQALLQAVAAIERQRSEVTG